MAQFVRAVALCCAVALATTAAYTVDCNHEYTDCDTELSKLADEDDTLSVPQSFSNTETTQLPVAKTTSTTTTTTTKPPETTTEIIESKTEDVKTTVTPEEILKPKARLLFSNSDDLRNFANALHNQSHSDRKKDMGDLSDVNLDADEEDEPVKIPKHKELLHDQFFTNLQAPFHPMLVGEMDEETGMCKDNDLTYKVGERVDRGCDESCECVAGGTMECFPRCKHPYIRRGRRIEDPLCFESPVDECCSIIACATGNESKGPKMDLCRYGNDTHTVGSKWFIGCEQTCTCEANSVVTCKRRCNPPSPSENCINVQDPNDACCEIQVCDVSQDAHEEPENITSSVAPTATSSTFAPITTELINKDTDDTMKNNTEQREHKPTMRPLVLAEPIGSVKVLQNNSVQVNLIHANNTDDPIHLQLSSDGGKTFQDVELIYSNLILNLEGGKDYVIKTKETGTKINFTITSTDGNTNEVPNEDFLHNFTKMGCVQDGQFYDIGEEFHIGCTELCECTGPDMRECAALVCPSHVGLELMSKGCVRWAPSPPAEPPNCCPRAARCLSDGTCHYNGIAIPNWTEVPVAISGCEERCFCENGELDCQEACSTLPPVPPQTLRCPPLHRPGHVNISDEDCCKQWGCLPLAGTSNKTTYNRKIFGDAINYVTPIPFVLRTLPPVLPMPQETTESTNFFKQRPVPNVTKSTTNLDSFPEIPQYTSNDQYNKNQNRHYDNITVFTLDDPDSMIKIIQPELSITGEAENNSEKQNDNDVRNDNSLPKHSIGIPDRKLHALIKNSDFNYPIQHPHHFSQLLPIKVLKSSMKKPNQLGIYFMPAKELFDDTENIVKPSVITPYVLHSGKDSSQNKNIITNNNYKDNSLLLPISKSADQISAQKNVFNVLRNDNLNVNDVNNENDVLWHQDTKMHLMKKVPNVYQTVLMKHQTTPKLDRINEHRKAPRPFYAIDAENFLSQLDMSSGVTRNLGRSADKSNIAEPAGPIPSNFPTHPPLPAFLPTVPPQLHFPQDDIADYDQNNIHRQPTDNLPPGLPIPPSFGNDNKKLSVLSMEADSPTSIKMLFGLPPVLVGLRGSVDLRYTDQADDDITRWFSQVFAPTDEVLTTPRLEFTLGGLKPSTTYKIRGKLFLHNLPVEPESEIRVVRTLDSNKVVPTEEKRREVDSRLIVMDVNDTVAHVSWRHFTEEELQLIDGVQVRYRPIGTPIYSMTELLHHSRSNAELHDLRPGTRYEASLVLIPPPRAVTELHDPGRVEFTTSPYLDPYNWTVTIEARAVGSEAAELTWRGVPSPAERWVRVYRAAHACGSTTSSIRREHDAFRLAARDLPPAVTLTGLEPNTRCRVWLELFLTNGKVKTSNVIEINTKSLDSPEPIDNEIESASIAGSRTSPRGDYYGALVVVGVVAALGALTSLLLLLVVVRRHHTRSVAITPTPSAPRESSLPPYDNPAYKLELQQETMDL